MAEELITRREAAALLRVHTNTVRAWEAAGRFTHKRAKDGTVLLRRAEVDRVAKERDDAALGDAGRLAVCESELEMTKTALARLEKRYDELLKRVVGIAEEKRK